MIELPNFDNAFEYENNFYLSCDSTRIKKILAHYEIFKLCLDRSGAIVECGVFKGVSLSRFAMMSDLLCRGQAKEIIGFDMFAEFPETEYEPDQPLRDKFVNSAGSSSISVLQLQQVLKHKNLATNVELIPGDITLTVPEYVRDHPDLEISMLNLDTDIYEPAVTILEELYPRLVPGGILILDDYGVFPGETKAVDDYFSGTEANIQRLPFADTPCFIVKEDGKPSTKRFLRI